MHCAQINIVFISLFICEDYYFGKGPMDTNLDLNLGVSDYGFLGRSPLDLNSMTQ